MESEDRLLLMKMEERIGETKAKAEEALRLSQEAQKQTVITEERAKSIQHRIDNQDVKLNGILFDLQSIKTVVTEGAATSKTIKTLLQIFGAVISVSSLVVAVLRLLQNS